MSEGKVIDRQHGPHDGIDQPADGPADDKGQDRGEQAQDALAALLQLPGKGLRQGIKDGDEGIGFLAHAEKLAHDDGQAAAFGQGGMGAFAALAPTTPST